MSEYMINMLAKAVESGRLAIELVPDIYKKAVEDALFVEEE